MNEGGMTERTRTVLELAGVGCVVAGVGWLWLPAGLIVLGAALLLISWRAS